MSAHTKPPGSHKNPPVSDVGTPTHTSTREEQKDCLHASLERVGNVDAHLIYRCGDCGKRIKIKRLVPRAGPGGSGWW